MAGDNGRPSILFTSPTFQGGDEDSIPSNSRDYSKLRQRPSDRRRLRNATPRQSPTSSKVYLGSYAKDFERHRTSIRGSLDVEGLHGSVAVSPRASTSHLQLEHLLLAVDVELDSYGVQELRDGFFDASFYRPLHHDHSEMMRRASETLPDSFQRNHPLSLRDFFPQQWHEMVEYVTQITTSRAGIRLLKSFLGFFISYIICLVPASRDWLGRYNYIMVLSAIFNHPGRPLGSQIDGALLTILGTAAGLGWGSLALYVSTSTDAARSGYGGVLATFLVIFTVIIAWLRCVFIRFYQAVLSAGIAICYTCLADTSKAVGWTKILEYGVPWALGQGLCLLISILIFPDTGSHSLTLAFDNSLQAVRHGLTLPRPEGQRSRRDLTWNFVNLSQAVRDFSIDLSISRFHPSDVQLVRNLIQGVIRAILAIRTDTALLDTSVLCADTVLVQEDAATIDPALVDNCEVVLRLISKTLAWPTRSLLDAMLAGTGAANATIMAMGGYKTFAFAVNGPQNLRHVLEALRVAKAAFDSADGSMVDHPELPSTYSDHPEAVKLFLFVHPVRQAADKVDALLEQVLQMQQRKQGLRLRFPSYPLAKSLLRSNAQVRHDRGGLTAGFYFQIKNQLERTMRDLRSKIYVPTPRHPVIGDAPSKSYTQMPIIGKQEEEKEASAKSESQDVSDRVKLRYRIWKLAHSLQGFEARFAFKVTLVTTLISVPAWLPQSRIWWNNYESWWTVVTVWLMMHPRVGGTLQDFGVRVFYAGAGALWAGFAYAADDGNPYVIAVFALLFMIPMLHRYTQSSHPRSGILGCISFTVVSLGAYTEGGKPSIVGFAWTRGMAFVVGVVAALLTNWILWPFVARHELRKSLSSMMLHSAILYRSVVAKYIYYTEGEEPGPEDVVRSEMLEGRLREGFVRMRQLMELTRHEIRLRGPFDPLPYSALIDACERFFEHLVEVRQSSLYFQPSMPVNINSATTTLLAPRRDAVAVILLNIYVLATALRTDRPVPRYLPSAAAARRRLLDRMEEVEAERASAVTPRQGKGKRWAEIYHFAYSSALTDIVEELQQLQRYTKEITGEVGFEPLGTT